MSSMAYLNARSHERATLADLGRDILDRCAENGTEPTAEERAQLDKWSAQVRVLDAEIAQLDTALRADRQFEGVLNRRASEDEAAERRAEAQAQRMVPEERMSFGERFIASDAFRAYKGRGTMEPVEFEGFLETRAAIDTTVLDLPPVMWDGPRGYVTTTPLLDVLGRERVSSGSLEYITWGTADPLAGGPIAEGALKPEADITPDTVPISLSTYAHWKAITRQALEDFPRIRSIVEGKLRGGLASKLEQVASETLQAATVPPVVNTDILAGIRQGIGAVQAAGYQPNAIVLNPSDYADLDIDASAQAGNGPVRFGTFWGLRPVPAAAIPAGTVYVGDFKEGVTWFDRNTTSVYMTDSHSDYFVRNLLVVLAEQRAAFAVTEPAALAKVTATAVAARSTSK